MEKGFTRYLIGYTISDDDTREKFREMLGRKFQDQPEWINESMFKLDSGGLQDVVGKLKEIFDEVKRMKFKGNTSCDMELELVKTRY